jgi:hypothetical protein
MRFANPVTGTFVAVSKGFSDKLGIINTATINDTSSGRI